MLEGISVTPALSRQQESVVGLAKLVSTPALMSISEPGPEAVVATIINNTVRLIIITNVLIAAAAIAVTAAAFVVAVLVLVAVHMVAT